MESSTKLMFHVLFGAVGAGYFVYGRKQRRAAALLAGIGLCVFPYFIDSVFWLVGIGIVLAVLPFIVKE